jgi:hypothetical protein
VRGPFALHTPQLLEAELKKAGFSNIRTVAYDTTIVVPDFKHYWDTQKAGGASIRRALDAVPEAQRAQAEKEALGSMMPWVANNRGEFPAQIIAGLGFKA